MNKKKISNLFRKYTNLIFVISIIVLGIIFNSSYDAYKQKENDSFQKLISNIYLKNLQSQRLTALILDKRILNILLNQEIILKKF